MSWLDVATVAIWAVVLYLVAAVLILAWDLWKADR